MGEMTKLETARRASGITLEHACEITGVSMPTMIAYQKDPARMPFGQFFALVSEMGEDARGIASGTLAEVDAGNPEWKPLRDLTMGEYCAARRHLPAIEMELARVNRKLFA